MSFEFPRADKPENVGLSSPRLGRIRDALQADIDKAVVPGAVALVARRGQIASLDALGYRDREAGAAMKLDTVFRIASMTKPFTSVAAMMLAEEGRLLIADPVSRFIPEFADLQVAVDSDDRSDGKPKIEPSRREMSVHDLLRHTSGLTYAHLTGPLLKSRYEGAGVVDEKQTNAEMVGKLGRLPLAYQPGTTWQYGVSTDVLGRVVEVASGMELDRSSRSASANRSVCPIPALAQSTRTGRLSRKPIALPESGRRCATPQSARGGFPAAADCCRPQATMRVLRRCS